MPQPWSPWLPEYVDRPAVDGAARLASGPAVPGSSVGQAPLPLPLPMHVPPRDSALPLTVSAPLPLIVRATAFAGPRRKSGTTLTGGCVPPVDEAVSRKAPVRV